MDSSASFAAATKHLFRHLHEPRALRKNPLVRHVFEDPLIGGLGRVREHAVLDRIHQLVRQAAEYCRDAELVAGKDERALRQYAIVTLQCLERRPVREVAAALGISTRQCYRERAEIGRRVADYICAHNDTPTLSYLPELDGFRFLMHRAMHRAAFGDMGAAFRECNDLIDLAPSIPQKIEAFRVRGSVALHFGDVKRTKESYTAAQALWAEHRRVHSSPARNVAQASIDLMGFQLAYYLGDTAGALRRAKRAAAGLEPVQADAPAYVRELYIEILYELGATFWALGNADKGYDCIVDAEANLRHVRTASSLLRTQITVTIWRLRNRLLMNAKNWYPSWQRLRNLETAFEKTYESGSLSEAAVALDALTEYHAFAGNDADALRLARLAVLLNKQQPNARMRAHTLTKLAESLLSTRYWEYGFSLLTEQQPEAPQAFYRALTAHLAAARALRLHRFDDAWSLANVTDIRGEPAALTVRRKLIAAAAAHGLERRREAHTLIDAAIPAAQKLGLAPLIRDAYDVAAKVTGDSRFEHQAREVTRLLST